MRRNSIRGDWLFPTADRRVKRRLLFARRALRRDVASRRRMIESNLRLAAGDSLPLRHQGLALLDLIERR